MIFIKYLRREIEIGAMQEGRQERDYMAVAKHLLSLVHLDVQAASQATGLSLEELEKLQKEFKKY
jgi:hypothetical protein